jgi:threonylcarbamoyladenosine tRNA methylthiotransferase MtaB
VARLSGEGFREVVLTGIHLGNYGRDLSEPTSLLHLLEEIEQQETCQRLRLGSLEPLDITPEIVGFIAGSRIICPHLHIPLQSGSDTVLSRMNRGYDSRYFCGLVKQISEVVPDVCLGFDVIAGFPGETDQEFEETVSLIDELPVAYLHVFPFSSRPGTKAATMPGHLQSRLITERAGVLRELGGKKQKKFHKGFIGRTMEVLVMKAGNSGLWSGITGNYLMVRFACDTDMANKIVQVRITDVDDDLLMAELLQ